MRWLDLLRVDKYEVPHRSGVIACLVAYIALCVAAIPLEYHGEDGTPSLSCTLFPFMPSCWSVPDPPPPEPVYQATRLVFCPNCKVKDEGPKKCILEVLSTDQKVFYFEDGLWPDTGCPSFGACFVDPVPIAGTDSTGKLVTVYMRCSKFVLIPKSKISNPLLRF